MTNNERVGLFERKVGSYQGDPYLLHLPEGGTREMKRAGDEHYELDLHDVVTGPTKRPVMIRERGDQAKAIVTALPGWTLLTREGTLVHPDDPQRTWKPNEQQKLTLTSGEAEAEYRWFGEDLAVSPEARKSIEVILESTPAIWGSVSPELQERKDQVILLELLIATREAFLQRKFGSLTDEVTRLEERRIELAQALPDLESKQAQLDEIEKKLEGHLAFMQTLQRNSTVSETTASWGPEEEVKAIRHLREQLQVQQRPMPWIDLLTIHLGLMYAPFTILQGGPGSGKTSALKLYGQHIGMDVQTIPVSSAWATQDDVMGSVDLIEQAFIPGPLGRILLNATNSDPAQPSPATLVILDEINLITVEHVFANVMSILALDDPASRSIHLHDRRPDGNGRYPLSDIPWPKGLLVAGTANDDHTVVSFSDRFRDRATIHTMEGPKLEDIITASQHPDESTVAEAPFLLTQETWDAWRQRRNSLAPDAVKEINDLVARLLRPFTDSTGRAPLISIRSLRRSQMAARHAYQLLQAFASEIAQEVQEDPSTPLQQAQLAVSLGLLPNMLQRSLNLINDPAMFKTHVNSISQEIHPALRGRLPRIEEA